MRLSQLFFKTFKEDPQEADIPSHQLLEKGGFIKRLARGHYTYTPLMMIVLRKLEAIIRQELKKEGSQEIVMPLLQPKSLWEQTDRWAAYKAEKLIYTTIDRQEQESCLAPTHEEAVTSLAKNWLTSYKQLPVNLFQIGTKFRDEIRPRFGLMRSKEFIMKDAYSFSATEEQMQDQYQRMRRAYQNILRRLKLDFVVVQADSGKIGNSQSEEVQILADIGEDTLLICGDYAYNSEKAPCIPKSFTYDKHKKELEKFSTPDTKTIDEVVSFTQEPKEIMLKALVYKLIYKNKVEFVVVGIRADREVNPVKLINHFKALEMELASEEEIKKIGLVQGFVGPIGCPVSFVADLTCQPMVNFICGANQKDFHYKNVNWERDCKTPQFHDFCQAKALDRCPHVEGGVYHEKRGIEVGHIFNLGDRYSKAMDATFQDVNGRPTPFLMGCYGIGVGRCIQAAIEQKYDDKGIVWPLAIAPFQLLVTAVNTKDEAQKEGSEKIYHQLLKLGVDVLLDDRIERLGFKLKDSDLIGIPYKIIIGNGYTSDHVLEIEPRSGEKELIPTTALKEWVQSRILEPLALDIDIEAAL